MNTIDILFLAANPTGTSQLHVDEELRSINEKIRASHHRDLLRLTSAWAIRNDDLLQLLNLHKPHIVHFSGHGNPQGEIVLVGKDRTPQPVNVKTLKSLFATLKDNIQVVVLNACYSQWQAKTIAEVIDCAIGMSDLIEDEAAITFAASFYRAIGFGRSVKDAFEQGIVALRLDGVPEDNKPTLWVKEGVDPSKLFLINLNPPENIPQSSTDFELRSVLDSKDIQIDRVEQLILTRVEAEYSANHLSGYQVVYKSTGISPNEVAEIRQAVESFVTTPGQERQSRWQYLVLSTQRIVVATSNVLKTDIEIIDRSGRPGTFLAHCYVFTGQQLGKVENNPFAILDQFFFVSTTEDFRRLIGLYGQATGVAQALELELHSAVQQPIHYWKEEEIQKLAILATNADKIKSMNKNVLLIGSQEEIREALRVALYYAVDKLRCTFNTHIDNAPIPPVNAYWALGISNLQHGSNLQRGSNFILVDVSKRYVVTPFENLFVPTIKIGHDSIATQQILGDEIESRRAKSNKSVEDGQLSINASEENVSLHNTKQVPDSKSFISKMLGLKSSKSIICPFCMSHFLWDGETNICPSCTLEIPPLYRNAVISKPPIAPFFLQIGGYSQAGKTTWLFAFTRMLTQMARLWTDFYYQASTEETLHFVRNVAYSLRHGLPPATHLGEQQAYIMILNGMMPWSGRSLDLIPV